MQTATGGQMTTTTTQTLTRVELPEYARAIIEEFEQAKADAKAAGARKANAENALRALMAGADEGELDGAVRVTIAQRNRSNIDRKLLQQAFPEAHDACLTETTYTVLTTH